MQAFRELSALDLISIRLAEELTAEPNVSLETPTQKIAEVLHDIFSPVAMRLHMDFGFTNVEPIYIGKESLIGDMKDKFFGCKWNEMPATFISRDIASYRVLRKQLTARVLATTITSELHDQNIDRFIIGNLVIAVNDDNDEYSRPALGTNGLKP